MGYSEIVVVLIVYSGIIAFFLVPFQSRWSLIGQQQSNLNFISVLIDNLCQMIFQKKAIFAPILLFFTLFIIWSLYEGTEYHFNAHSGYPFISTDLIAVYTISGVILYTVVLFLLLAFGRTLKVVRTQVSGKRK